MDRLETELNRVLRELDKLLKNTSAPQAPQPPAAQPPRADMIERLRQLLDVGDGAAVEVFAATRTQLIDVLGSAVSRELALAMDVFDFERALKLLGQPATRLTDVRS
jgi:hypothetical protein